jgi:hypothetical protein
MNHDLDRFCENLYAEIRQYWEGKRKLLPRTGELKYGIFYSPVRHRPALMIVGANPGFDSDDDTKAPPVGNLFYGFGERDENEYKITAVLRKLFQLANQEKMLRDSVVTNLLFFKSRCLGKHRKTRQGWCDNGNADVRKQIEGFCQTRVAQIVNRLDPMRILVLGLATWEKVAEGQVKVAARRPKMSGRLALSGTVFNRSALGIIHPTGARISDDECRDLAPVLSEFLLIPARSPTSPS